MSAPGSSGAGVLPVAALGAALSVAVSSSGAKSAHPMVVVNERDVMREEPAPHGNLGMSTAYRISDVAPNRTMDFRKRTLHVGSAIGLHVLSHDEVYYVVDGEGEVASDGVTKHLSAGSAAYLYAGANVGIKQVGPKPLTLIIAYPLPDSER
ncbi:MAG TPA: cupin domain-containing protein [Steroidobacteraceae bacterium]|jgi:mannose-6-phosphate isomerase-like protein (cupin superfamily)|nr:cupin domain-containing protein [Steroidobacteraceae bacterium]